MYSSKRTLTMTAAAVTLSLMAGSALAQKGETVKIAFIDPLSGLLGPVGQNQVKTLHF
eukprot:gene11244-14295_t